MARVAILSLAFLAVGSTGALAQMGDGCQIPGPQYTFKSLDALPKEVSSLVLQKWPRLKPTMAGCPATGKPDRENLCLYNAVEYGVDWVVVASTPGTLPIKQLGVFFYSKGMEARELHYQQEIAIPRCSLNRVAGVTPPSPKSNMLPKQGLPVPSKQSTPAPRPLPAPG